MSIFKSEIGEISKIPGSNFFVVTYKKELHHYYNNIFSKYGKCYKHPDNECFKLWHIDDNKESRNIVNSLANTNFIGSSKIVGISFSDAYNNYIFLNRLNIMCREIEESEILKCLNDPHFNDSEILTYEDPNYTMENTPIDFALKHKKYKVVHKLLDFNIIPKYNFFIYLFYLIEIDNTSDLLILFLRLIDYLDIWCYSFICIASRFSNCKYLENLIEKGHNVNGTMDKISPLLMSICYNRYENMIILIKNGADLFRPFDKMAIFCSKDIGYVKMDESFVVKDIVNEIYKKSKEFDILNKDFLKILKYFDIEYDVKFEECFICYTNSKNFISLFCKHKFCKGCISTLQNKDCTIVCPICRHVNTYDKISIKIRVKNIQGNINIYEFYPSETKISDLIKAIQKKSYPFNQIEVLFEGKALNIKNQQNIISYGIRDNSLVYSVPKL